MTRGTFKVVQGILPKSVFDWKDLVATLLAGSIALGSLLIVHRFLPESAAASKIVPKE